MLSPEKQVASIGVRFIAVFLDGLILLFPYWTSQVFVPFLGPILVSFLYAPLFHMSPLQATIGKRVMGIQVGDESGNPLSLGKAYLRHLVVFASACLLFVGHIVAFFTKQHQALHDIVAGSYVFVGADMSMGYWEAWSSTIRNQFSQNSAVGISPVSGQLNELEQLTRLKERGTISDAEFDRLKAEILARR